MSSDEDDYMSNKFIEKEVTDVCPGLPKRKVDQRAFEQYKKKMKTQTPNKQQQEAVARDKGLNQALTSENKGFQMLAKMGYKSGSSLGTTSRGLIEPISITLKADKAGLGKPPKKPQSCGSTAVPKVKITKEMEESYRKSVQTKKNLMMIRKYFLSAQASCLYLDQENGIELPAKEYFWPFSVIREIRKKEQQQSKSITSSDEDSESEDEQLINEDLLKGIIEYLRGEYYYCIYCASKGVDIEDLNSFCPGANYDDHDID